METRSIKISDTLYLVRQEISKKNAVAKKEEVPTNHVAIIDCSGSMYSDLPKIREQLKSKLPKLLSEKDSLSVIWFSGRGEYGVLMEAEPVATLKDLQDVNKALDRWLRTVGLTGFKEPLEELPKLVERVSKKRPGSVFSLFFMSDGCDNQWPRADILKAVEKAAGSLASATFVEYGYYADRPLLTQMAEKAGGQLIFAEDFDKYQPAFEAAMQKRPTGAPRIEVGIKGDPICGFTWMADGGDLTTFTVESGKIKVPEDTLNIYYLSPGLIGTDCGDLNNIAAIPAGESTKTSKGWEFDSAYAAVSLFSVRMQPNLVLPLLKALGDVQFIEDFSGCYGKQRYSAFMDAAKAAAFDTNIRYKKGYDPNKVPKDDAFTLLELLQILSDDEGNRVLLDHSEFKYSKIGRGRLDSSENLTADELDQIQKITARIAAEKDVKKIKELNLELSSITDKKVPALKFEQDEEASKYGFPISSLTFNEDKPNVSILIRKQGKVDVSARLPDSLKGKIPEKFDTFIFRNYAIIKDGLVNVEKLPVILSAATYEKLNEIAPIGMFELSGSTQVLNLKVLPIINRKMVQDVSAKDFFQRQWDLTKAQAAQKIYNTFHKEMIPSVKTKGFADIYTQEGADWLKEQGFTDYSGFGPKTVQAPATDVYVAKEMKVSLKGFSKIPSVKELKEMITKNKVNAPGSLMRPILEETEAFLASPVYTKAAAKEKILEVWLDGQMKGARKDTRRLIYEIARTSFSIIVGQGWFKEFVSLDDNEMELEFDGQKVLFKAELREVEIKI